MHLHLFNFVFCITMFFSQWWDRMVEGPFSHMNWRLIYAMVVENNAIRLREIRCVIIECHF